MNVKQLKKKIEKLKLIKTGNKKDLIERLRNERVHVALYLQQEQNETVVTKF